MTKQRKIMIIMGLAAMLVMVARLGRDSRNEENLILPGPGVEETVEMVEVESVNEDVDTAESENEKDATVPGEGIEKEVVEQNEGEASQTGAVEATVVAQEPMVQEPMVQDRPEEIEEAEIPEDQELEASENPLDQTSEEEAVETESQGVSAESVDQMEDALSASDYAKGLSLLAQLPIETVDRFVELRKDGFTAEEQAEVKAILLASYQGEDLDWIVKMYHKLQP